MPLYTYKAKDKNKNCDYCRNGFEVLQKLNEPFLQTCPKCKAEVIKQIPQINIGFSITDLNRRAKESGFHKLKKVDKGKYEKIF